MSRGYQVGECIHCDRTFKRVEEDDGACWDCRGWSICTLCGEAKSTLDFSVYQKHGRRHIASRCRQCLAVGGLKYRDRESIWRAYGLATGEVVVVLQAREAYRHEQLRITRQVPPEERVPHPTPPDVQFRAVAFTEAKWRDMAGALCELMALEPEDRTP